LSHRIYSYKTGIQKVQNKFIKLSLVLLLAVTGISGAAPLFSSHSVSALAPHITYTDVALTQPELDNNWVTDRTTPSGGYDSVTFDGQTSAELRVDNTNASTASGFYRTEGIQRSIPGSDAIKANLYVDGAWQGKSVRAGLWGVAHNSVGTVSAYPIIEFTTAGDSSHVGWRVWDDVNGNWTNLSNPYSWNSWNTLEIVHNNGSGKFNVYINGQIVATNAGSDSTSLNAVILNGYNYATGDNADNYAAHWSNLGYGDVTGTSVSACATTNSVFTTDLSTWNTSETRSAGHNVIVSSGLHIYTDDASSNAKAAGYYTTNFPLSSLGDKTIAQSIDYQATTGITPGLQLVTDFDNNGTPDGILVGEATYGNSWWLSNSAQQFVKDNSPNTGGGNGSSWFGTPDQWLSSFPDAKVLAIGYSLGSGVHGDGILKRISLGCTDYTFGFAPPAVPTLYRPADGAVIRPSDSTLNWNDVTDPNGPVTYNYQSSYSDAVNSRDNGFTSPIYHASTGTTSQIDATHSATHVYYWQVQACVGVGNCSNWSGPWKVTIDGVLPTVSDFRIDNPAAAYSSPINASSLSSDNFGLKNVKFFVTDPEDRSGTLVCSGNGTHLVEALGTLNSGNSRYEASLDTSGLNGQYCVSVQSEDNASNHSAIIGRQLVTIDNTAPVATITAPSDGDTVHGTVTVSGNVSDVNPDHYYFVVKDSHGVVKAGPGVVNQATVSSWSWNTKNVSDGEYTIVLEARDAADNKDAGSVATIHVTVDNTAPTATIDAYNGADTTPTLTGTVNDPTASLTVAIDGGTAAAATNNGDGTWSFTVPTALSAGSHTIVLTATDTAGNPPYQTTANVTVVAPHASQTGLDNSDGRGNSDQATGHQSTVTVTPNNDGHVLGAETDNSNLPTVNFSPASNKVAVQQTSNNFLGLGWWWLAVLAVMAIFLALVFRKTDSNKQA
jgi:hypothetical protein